MGVIKNPFGPLPYATLYQIDDTVFFDKTRPPAIEPMDDDVIYLVRNFDRLDTIANSQMGNVQLGWIILLRNNLRLAPNDLIPGNKIFIPTRSSLQRRGIIQ